VSRTSLSAAERQAGLRGRVRGAVRTLNPGCLALVMATGIMSVAMSEHGVPGLSRALLWLAAWVATFAAMLYRLYGTLLREPPAAASALAAPSGGP